MPIPNTTIPIGNRMLLRSNRNRDMQPGHERQAPGAVSCKEQPGFGPKALRSRSLDDRPLPVAGTGSTAVRRMFVDLHDYLGRSLKDCDPRGDFASLAKLLS
jgi:hypothetical protein